MIKKYKNGKIYLDIKDDLKSGYYQVGNGHEKDMKELERFYHDEMFMNDLSINQINGYLYIVDYNTNLVYDLPHNHFGMFLETLGKGEKVVLIPYGKRMSKSLLQDLENGY